MLFSRDIISEDEVGTSLKGKLTTYKKPELIKIMSLVEEELNCRFYTKIIY